MRYLTALLLCAASFAAENPPSGPAKEIDAKLQIRVRSLEALGQRIRAEIAEREVQKREVQAAIEAAYGEMKKACGKDPAVGASGEFLCQPEAKAK